MERKIDKFLEHWQLDSNRKPLVVYGSKQVGKTYTILKFGENNYHNTVYIDTNNNTKLVEALKKQNTIDGIINELSAISNKEITKDDTLVVLDNVNNVDIVNTIKTIGKFKNDYHIILITSLKDNLSKFKGIELQFKSLFPMDFEEYLTAVGKIELIDFIKTSFKNNTKNPFHKLALEYFNKYIVTGGMPEAINLSLREENTLLLNSIEDKIIDCYQKEMSLQDNLIDIVRSKDVYLSIPQQLSKSNKKFQYGFIKDGGRSKEYENSLTFLHNNGLIYKCYKLDDIKSPISNYKDKDNFKVYMNDTGILYKMLKVNDSIYNSQEDVRQVLYENSVAISLVNSGYSLFYYQSMGKAFIDFIIQTRTGNIIPIELVPFSKTKSKAMAVYKDKFKPNEAIRITQDNFCVRKGIRYIPIYATFCLSELV